MIPDHVRKLARQYLDMRPSDPRNDQAFTLLERACKQYGILLREVLESAMKVPSLARDVVLDVRLPNGETLTMCTDFNTWLKVVKPVLR